MKSYKKEIAVAALFVVLAATLIALEFAGITFSADETKNGLITDSLTRGLSAAFVTALCFIAGNAPRLSPFKLNGIRSLLWTLPCALVAAANFPYSALAGGEAVIERSDLIWLFLLDCLMIGVFEELLFRGLIQSFISERFAGRKYSDFFTVLFTSAIFGLWHLINLFGGASAGATFLQVGYTFLIGAMLSACLIKTGNIWICVILHAAFDAGGMIVPTLGTGTFQDAVFWTLSAIAGAICLVHVLIFLLKPDKKNDKEKEKCSER